MNDFFMSNEELMEKEYVTATYAIQLPSTEDVVARAKTVSYTHLVNSALPL